MPSNLRELSTVDQFRVYRCLTRGEAPDDPGLAAVTINVAGDFPTRSRTVAALFRWWPMVLALCLIVAVLPGALDGQVEMAIFLLLIVLGVIGNLMLNPWTRPKNVAKSVEASKRVLAVRAAKHEPES